MKIEIYESEKKIIEVFVRKQESQKNFLNGYAHSYPVLREKRSKTQISLIFKWLMRGKQIKKMSIIRDYCDQMYVHKFGNIEHS